VYFQDAKKLLEMKGIKQLWGFFLFLIVLGSCFNPPEYSTTPEIKFDRAVFVDTAASTTLAIFLDFKDGDGDLGLDQNALADRSAPYNDVVNFQTNAAGAKIPILGEELTVTVDGKTTTYNLLKPASSSAGSLLYYSVVERNPLYSDLPIFVDRGCPDYQRDVFAIREEDQDILLGDYSVIQKTIASSTNPSEKYLLVYDTLYQTHNANFYNIDVDILLEQNDGTYQAIDLSTLCSTLNGRFPILGDSHSAVEGNLQYNINSSFIPLIIGSHPFKIKMKIRDRLLHVSNEIITNAMTLQGIKGNG
jgi:hypothetical protein